jgi:hypothetical protein
MNLPTISPLGWHGIMSLEEAVDMMAFPAQDPNEPDQLGAVIQQAVAALKARQISSSFSTETRDIRVLRRAFGIVVMLSKLRAHASGIPSSSSSWTSEGMFRTVLVAGTARTRWSTGIAACRVRTR